MSRCHGPSTYRAVIASSERSSCTIDSGLGAGGVRTRSSGRGGSRSVSEAVPGPEVDSGPVRVNADPDGLISGPERHLGVVSSSPCPLDSLLSAVISSRVRATSVIPSAHACRCSSQARCCSSHARSCSSRTRRWFISAAAVSVLLPLCVSDDGVCVSHVYPDRRVSSVGDDGKGDSCDAYAASCAENCGGGSG